MFFDFDGLAPRDRYKLVTASVVPRPIAWLVTEDEAGVRNAAPFSFFNVFSSDPMIVGIGCSPREAGGVVGGVKDTVANIRALGEFVLCLVDEDRLEAMNVTAADWTPDEDELREAGLTAAPSVKVRPPRIAKSPVALECVLHQLVPAGSQVIVLGRVVAMHLRDDCVLDPARCYVDTARLRLVGRLGSGGGYVRLNDVVELPRVDAATVRRRRDGR
ncbi:flavin reductase family protein [Roseomonas elaeocarpi]|uniref:Flavin reductase family protein n=1 Tax=Roseomonas elaeocarpi TaxID=907779 RepID=A0ABV6JRB4_9PROT